MLIAEPVKINWKLSHRKSWLSICSGTYNLAVQFMSALKPAWKFELSFSSTLLFIASSWLVCFLRLVAINSALSIAIESYASWRSTSDSYVVYLQFYCACFRWVQWIWLIVVPNKSLCWKESCTTYQSIHDTYTHHWSISGELCMTRIHIFRR